MELVARTHRMELWRGCLTLLQGWLGGCTQPEVLEVVVHRLRKSGRFPEETLVIIDEGLTAVISAETATSWRQQRQLESISGIEVAAWLHATWLVNSATHLWGKRRFETKDDSRNSWWVALLTGGEGWHNNHHAHPVSARHGLTWYEFDINYYGIWLLSKIGLAEKIQIAKFDPENPKPAGVN